MPMEYFLTPAQFLYSIAKIFMHSLSKIFIHTLFLKILYTYTIFFLTLSLSNFVFFYYSSLIFYYQLLYFSFSVFAVFFFCKFPTNPDGDGKVKEKLRERDTRERNTSIYIRKQRQHIEVSILACYQCADTVRRKKKDAVRTSFLFEKGED